MTVVHAPVLLNEIRAHLHIRAGDTVIDATLDGGGHARMLLEEIYPGGVLLGIEQDWGMLVKLRERIDSESRDTAMKHVWQQLIPHHGNFRDIIEIARSHHIEGVRAILFDLGVSRWHFMESKRGFSFQDPEEPLSMLMREGPEQMTAAELLNQSSEKDLADMLFTCGEVRNSFRIARAIIEQRRKRRFEKVGDLLALFPAQKGRRHPATRVFQALRIAANDELGALEVGLQGATELLEKTGRVAVISYHSLEDRIVKNYFKAEASDGRGGVVTKKPIVSSREEQIKNPSSRSAKLRILEKI